MLTKTIKYTDYRGREQEDTFFFNLSKAELIELQYSVDKTTATQMLENIILAEDNKRVMEEFKNILTMSIGEISENGKRFVKSEEISKNFLETEAYSILLLELISDAKYSAEFFTALLPEDLDETTAKLSAPAAA